MRNVLSVGCMRVGVSETPRKGSFLFGLLANGRREQFSAIQQALQKICRKFVYFTYCNFIPNVVYLVHQMREGESNVHLYAAVFAGNRDDDVGSDLGDFPAQFYLDDGCRHGYWLDVF